MRTKYISIQHKYDIEFISKLLPEGTVFVLFILKGAAKM